ncbi:ABC transporter substrate-binding protein [Paenibacillus beijingensis]|uniref:ABC transporter substrate-binding protein n=1 Tax=Paenibacillus beijingensis TaxID=1126833 RepID=A0A0D5NM15_9BACL|nr:extracellular solute-binding protein [Paenibacillus beijingensis]AJY76175.1 ABC transporter substrate-binding protein [Paenibacillus beijingensis]
MKRLVNVAFVSVLMGSVLAGCGSGGSANKENSSGTGAENTGSNKQVVVKVFQQKVEIADQLPALAAEYEKTHPGVKIEFESVLSSDYMTKLKAKLSANEMPDIFNNGGYSELNVWKDQLEDLSDQPWVGEALDVAKEPMMSDGKLYGIPINLEGDGLVYNKDMFAKAGITELPKTRSELEEVSKKLQAAGFTPFINNYDSAWTLGITMFNYPMAEQQDPNAFIAGLNGGTATFKDNPLFKEWTKFIDLSLKYGNKNPLTTDYNGSLAMFASEQGAMTVGGNWIQPVIDKINPNINAGLMPIPISDDAALNQKAVFAGPTTWVVYKNSKVKPEAKEFLNWLVTSAEGQDYLVKKFKLMPAFKNVKADPADLGGIAGDILPYIAKGDILGWQYAKYPDGSTKEFAASMQKYIAGKSNGDQMLAEFQQTWDKLKSK